MNNTSPRLIINLSRIGAVGGLRRFSESVVRCLRESCPEVLVVTANWKEQDFGSRVAYVPKALASSSATSILRPLAWWVYAHFLFPGSRDVPVLGTTHHVLPGRKTQIVTIHDLRPYFLPDSIVQRLYFRHLLPRAARRCTGVLTVSETTRQALISTFNLSADKVHVVPNSVDVSDFLPASTGPRNDPYLLMVGCTWRHKNVEEVLLNAQFWMHKYSLVLVMGAGQYRDKITRSVSKNGLNGRVKFMHNISKDALIRLYQGCSALVYPSVMEGFGIPPLEAMACGRPVIASDIPVFRELYSDIPIYVSLGNRNSWFQAFEALADEDTLRGRIEQGKATARNYSFERMCSALNTVLRSIWDFQ